MSETEQTPDIPEAALTAALDAAPSQWIESPPSFRQQEMLRDVLRVAQPHLRKQFEQEWRNAMEEDIRQIGSEPEPDEDRTWWPHPETGARLIIDRRDRAVRGDWVLDNKDAGPVQTREPGELPRRILRPAEVVKGGPTGWCVETGEERPPQPGDYHVGGITPGVKRCPPDGRYAVPRPIVTPLDPREFAAHGVEADADRRQREMWSQFASDTELPPAAEPTPGPTISDRGFKHWPPVASEQGQVFVYESSYARGPHLWLRVVDREDICGAFAHLSLDQAELVRDTLDTAIKSHYQASEQQPDQPTTPTAEEELVGWVADHMSDAYFAAVHQEPGGYPSGEAAHRIVAKVREATEATEINHRLVEDADIGIRRERQRAEKAEARVRELKQMADAERSRRQTAEARVRELEDQLSEFEEQRTLIGRHKYDD